MYSLAFNAARPLAKAASRRLVPAKKTLALLSSSSNNNDITSLIINAVGQDRLGIVSDVTGMVIEHGGNVGDSQAAKLGSHFSLMMHVSLPESQKQQLQDSLRKLKDMNATVFETNDVASSSRVTPRIAYQGLFTLEGADNPGIVHVMTTALAKHGLNISKMETDQEIAPHGGTMLFRIKGKAVAYEPLAASFDVMQIKSDLQDLGASLNCDVELEELDDDSTSASFYGG
ncbi:hypothetical protein MPSEU_000758300 [Mayamaea pseudoterrestris]|nr:hypothetical protein MPSEU_000758300 [Mayamaea pseudoterrestris]